MSSNIHGLFSRRAPSDDEEENNPETRFVGGLDARGGGSGLAVEPNPEASDSNPSNSIFNLASPAAPSDSAVGPIRRTITMYRDGFTVDSGPYRRLDDPANAEFLSSLARGMTPRELSEEASGGDITVGLVDKRGEEYVETFQSFSGGGQSLGSAVAAASSASGEGEGVINPAATTPLESPSTAEGETTSIQVRLLSGRRIVTRVPVAGTVHNLVDQIHASGEAGSDPYVLMSGFPPKQIKNLGQTIDEAGLAGASVTQKKA
mmetsp:Transcript_39331/g.57864  ORF Transcript_39331/g.57864 Transcript_39331/m.57864 type:complete len:262 (+) Transcript_39331:34-819(+)|eukprot:CAMPEP_0195526438 /NCGR_PEP_ID=MMETSP0794_2-20130614/27496_1 /TAXON_ID=515487 /ORGANISM="Stephanopyxis turris, Strain CCMP 815" /LENGTH=261 /DNA_ID=CAMNT_0040657123 /DNA_START=34 /DNA_END=819 /DNA_ORIENTATION=+